MTTCVDLVRFGITLPNMGEFGEIERLVELDVAAEQAGWDGVFLWDHLLSLRRRGP